MDRRTELLFAAMTWKRWKAGVVLAVVISLRMGASAFSAPADTSNPVVSVAFKPAAEHVIIGDSLPVYVMVENQSQAYALTNLQVSYLPNDFKVELLSRDPEPTQVASGTTVALGYRITPAQHTKPGKYNVLFDIRYRWRDGQGKVGNQLQALKDFSFEVKTLTQTGIAAPTVNVTAKAAADTLREGESLELYLFVENKASISVQNLTVSTMAPPFIEVVADCKPSPCKPPNVIPALAPFEARTSYWTAKLDSKTANVKYGKHTIFFAVQYDWKYGDTTFTSRTIAPAEISSSFFGSEAVSQVFGIPLNLIVYVLPGFCFLAVYWALTRRLLKKGEPFTPTSKDGIFYSVLFSVAAIFLYKVFFQRELHLYFTLGDLFEVSAMAAVAGSLVPLYGFVKRRSLERAEEARRYTERDSPLTVLKKALSRQANPTQYQEASVREGDREWKGIIVSGAGEPLVLRCQLVISPLVSGDDDVVTELDELSRTADGSDRLLQAVLRHSEANKIAVKSSPELERRVRYRDKDGAAWRDYGADIKIMDPKLQLSDTRNFHLIEFE